MDLNQISKELSLALERIAAAPDLTESSRAGISAPLYRAMALLSERAAAATAKPAFEGFYERWTSERHLRPDLSDSMRTAIIQWSNKKEFITEAQERAFIDGYRSAIHQHVSERPADPTVTDK